MKKSSASNPGQRSSLTAIAKLAGVSTATVSRALNGHPNVREETRLRIERIADEWGYLPSAAARSLSRSKNDIIGFILPQVESGFYASLLAGIDEASRARGYHLITALSHGDHRELHPGIRLLRERRIDGLLLLEPSIDRHDIARVKSAHMPFVLLQRPPVGDLPTVRIDDEGGGYLMGRHLIECSAKRVLVAAGPKYSADSQGRLAGFRRALAESNGRLEACTVVHTSFRPEEALPLLLPYFRGNCPPDTLFCLNDATALAMLRALSLQGLRVPEDVRVAGFDGIEAADYAQLTTVATPLREVGRVATGMLCDLIEGNPVSESNIVLPTVLCPRHSPTGHLRVLASVA